MAGPDAVAVAAAGTSTASYPCSATDVVAAYGALSQSQSQDKLLARMANLGGGLAGPCATCFLWNRASMPKMHKECLGQ